MCSLVEKMDTVGLIFQTEARATAKEHLPLPPIIFWMSAPPRILKNASKPTVEKTQHGGIAEERESLLWEWAGRGGAQ